MDRSYPSALRIEHRIRLRQRVAASACAGIAVCAMAFAAFAQRDPLTAPPLEAAPAVRALTAAAADTAPAVRRVYRYSVVPGGAANAAELARIIRSDKVVAAHYAGFNVDRARAVTVAAPRAVYVSYRKGDKVYWTAKKVMLQKGETLLTDGSNEMRARCANRISDTPRFPVEAHAPELESLDTLEDEPLAATEGGLTNVSAAELLAEDEAELAGQSYQLLWPAGGAPAPGESPARRRTPLASGYPPALPWPQSGLLRDPGAPALATLSPPPASGAFAADPLPGVDGKEPVIPTPASDPNPLIPSFDPARPAVPANPSLDGPQPADVPEPATPWLVAAALVAMRTLRKKR